MRCEALCGAVPLATALGLFAQAREWLALAPVQDFAEGGSGAQALALARGELALAERRLDEASALLQALQALPAGSGVIVDTGRALLAAALALAQGHPAAAREALPPAGASAHSLQVQAHATLLRLRSWQSSAESPAVPIRLSRLRAAGTVPDDLALTLRAAYALRAHEHLDPLARLDLLAELARAEDQAGELAAAQATRAEVAALFARLHASLDGEAEAQAAFMRVWAGRGLALTA